MTLKKKIIGFQGNFGSYSHQAVLKIFNNKNVKTSPSPLSEQALIKLKNKEVDYCVLPVENSIIGNIDVNTELIQRGNFFAIKEFYMRIKHHLLTLPNVSLEEIEEVYSHPAALAQCRVFLEKNNIKPKIEYDTGGACEKLIKNQYEKKTAVIAGEQCLKEWDVVSLSSDIQNNDNNFTRFLVLENFVNDHSYEDTNKTSLSFNTNNSPGALLKVLKVFEENKINLTKIESMPIPEDPFTYTFFLDCELGINNLKFREIRNQLNKFNINFKILGSYLKHPAYQWA